MTTPSRKIRVAVVDDDQWQRERIIADLRSIAKPPFVLNEVVIEGEADEFGDAHEIARRIVASSLTSPPWDVVLADVMMPDCESGGFVIARAVRDKYQGQKRLPLKLALVTGFPGVVAASGPRREFDVPEYAGWFHLFVKREGLSNVRTTDPLMSESAWRRALIQLVSLWDSERWGLTLLRALEDEDVRNSVFCSAKSCEMIAQAIDWGGNPKMDIIAITGATGTGKEGIAHFLHAHRMKRLGISGNIVPYQCSANIDASALETDLFGVGNGIFTGVCAQSGVFERASGGTLFLDEVQELSPENQGRLLRILQDHAIPKRGEQPPPTFRGTLVICATSSALIPTPEGRFRADFLGRIRKATIRVPPLRERRAEIVPAARWFLQTRSAYEGYAPELTEEAEQWLIDPRWPWTLNFRMLDSLLVEATLAGNQEQVTAGNLDEAARRIDGFFPETPAQGVSAAASPTAAESACPITAENLAAGKVAYGDVQACCDYPMRVALIVAGKELYRGRQGDFALTLRIKPNTLEGFLRDARGRIRNGDLQIDDMKRAVDARHHPALDEFVKKAKAKSQ